VPEPQELHVRSVDDVPADDTYSPAAQSVHDVHEEALAVSEYVPEPQALQVRSPVAVPAVDTYSPATQSVHDVHDVALVVSE